MKLNFTVSITISQEYCPVDFIALASVCIVVAHGCLVVFHWQFLCLSVCRFSMTAVLLSGLLKHHITKAEGRLMGSSTNWHRALIGAGPRNIPVGQRTLLQNSKLHRSRTFRELDCMRLVVLCTVAVACEWQSPGGI